MRLFLKRLWVWISYKHVCWTHLNVDCWLCDQRWHDRYSHYVQRRAQRLRDVKQELQAREDANGAR